MIYRAFRPRLTVPKVDIDAVAEATEMKPKSVRNRVGELKKIHGIKVKLTSNAKQEDDGIEDAGTPKKRKAKDTTLDGPTVSTLTTASAKKPKAAAKSAEPKFDDEEAETEYGSDASTPTPSPKKKTKQAPKKAKTSKEGIKVKED